MKQSIVTLDLEGVLVPEIWIAVAEKTGIRELRLTTRDIPDYDVLMKGRLNLLDQHGLKLSDIQQVISTLRPLEGGREFLDELRALTQVIILSDTFEEFAKPLMKQLDWPTLFCHKLEVENDRIVNYRLRQANQKQKSVAALKNLQLPRHRRRRFLQRHRHARAKPTSVSCSTRRFPSSSSFPSSKPVETYAELMHLIKEALK